MPEPVTRRRFLAAAAAGSAVATAGTRGATEPPDVDRSPFPIVGFSKPFIDLSFDETADLVAEVGWDGIECPIREGKSTHIAPANVSDELPKLVEALARRGKNVAIVTTSVVRLDAAGENVLRTAARLGIRRARLGFLRYPRDEHPAKRVAELRAALADIAAFAGEIGMQIGYQNHSGGDYVGAPIWDLYEAVKDHDARHVGACFDIGHAVVEGGLSWPIQARLLADRFVAVYCKDFFWERTSRGQQVHWCPWGDGVVPRAFLGWLGTTGFKGPLSQHHEYELGTAAERLAHFKRDLAALRGWLAG